MATAAWAAWLLILTCFGAWTPRQILVAAATDANDGRRYTENLALFLIAFLPSLSPSHVSWLLRCFLLWSPWIWLGQQLRISLCGGLGCLGSVWLLACCPGCPFFECLCRVHHLHRRSSVWDSVETHSALQVPSHHLNLVLLGGVVKTSYFLVVASFGQLMTSNSSHFC